MELDYIVSQMQMVNNTYSVNVNPTSVIECMTIHLLYRFPCMDQPDLKAKLKLSVVAPTDWVVISNEYD